MNARPALIAVLLTAGIGAAHAAESPPSLDAEFLEFLGSLDTEDEELREYLAERPVEAERPVDTRDHSASQKPAPRPAPVNATRQPAAKSPEQVKKP